MEFAGAYAPFASISVDSVNDIKNRMTRVIRLGVG